MSGVDFDAKAELLRRDITIYEDHDGYHVSTDNLVPLLVRLKGLEDALTEARTDAVTRLPVRAVLDSAFTRTFDRARRHGIGMAVLLIDIDHFKAVNDEHGHQVGDEVLRRVADVIQGEARSHDFVGRYGGEEIVVLMEGADEAAARALADRVRHSLAVLPFQGPQVTVSAGLAVLDGHHGPDTLFAEADRALYRAKAEGRNRVRSWVHPCGDTPAGADVAEMG